MHPLRSSASWPPDGTRAALGELQELHLLRGCAQLLNKSKQSPCPPQQSREKGTHQPCMWSELHQHTDGSVLLQAVLLPGW